MDEKILEDYYTLKISLKEVLQKTKLSQAGFYRYLKVNKLLPRREYYSKINTGNTDLDFNLKNKYSTLVKRCTNKPSYKSDAYKDFYYPPIYDWVEFCMDNKEKLLKMWDVYVDNDKDVKYAISIDRINNDGEYTLDNIQFVTNGFNAWKRNIRPVKVIKSDKEHLFMSSQEASLFFKLRRSTFGDILRGEERPKFNQYKIELCNVEEVLKFSSTRSEEDYYNKIFSK
jgi:hypothetical protein